MLERFQNTQQNIGKIPNVSGLYYFYDEDNNLLYIGKAKKLRSRIRGHRHLNHLVREGTFYRKIILAKGYTDKNEYPEILKESIVDFECRCLSSISPQVIDRIFQRTHRIEIEQMPHELTERKEYEMIQKLSPSFNSETACDEYYDILY